MATASLSVRARQVRGKGRYSSRSAAVEVKLYMQTRQTTILVVVAILVATQTALAGKLCLATGNASACASACCEPRTPGEESTKPAPSFPADHHPCCDESLASKAAQVLHGKSATELNVKASIPATYPPIEEGFVRGDTRLSARRSYLAPPYTRLNIYILDLSLRC